MAPEYVHKSLLSTMESTEEGRAVLVKLRQDRGKYPRGPRYPILSREEAKRVADPEGHWRKETMVLLGRIAHSLERIAPSLEARDHRLPPSSRPKQAPPPQQLRSRGTIDL